MKKKAMDDAKEPDKDEPYDARVRGFPSKALWLAAQEDALRKGKIWAKYVAEALRDRMRKKR